MPANRSVCVRNCCLNDDGICLGCFRSIEEICQWGRADESRRQQILKLVQARKASHPTRFKPTTDND